ncbi:DUF4374 domain-containing protein [Sphingobacterium sp. SGG-5]|uniref:DUF4374 domain-containing protein n=1 Tax=Sphingobacterium sp. SGG-5 TaxID=2710881 RepID=UPI0013EA7AD8|nr:DUF4374 domain-containing protein [Sphingobacterium sp. SGG-5]NGM62307.1 DUF4374 domain-containing protein [Sphingobacterium sp. SGG-5]
MKTIRHHFYAAVALSLAVATTSCSKDPVPDNGNEGPLIEGNSTYVLGVGVTDAENNSTNYIVHTSNLLSGKISLINNGILQEGYREYITVGNNFYSIGGLGVNNVDAYYINDQSRLVAKTGLVFENGASDYLSVDNGQALLGVQVATDANYDGNAEFFFVDVASNSIEDKVTVPTKDIYEADDNGHGWNHSGIAIRGNQAFQTIFPISKAWATPDVSRNYVAVYSYPDFEFQKLITDTRTGPAGAPLLRSGIFATESGDLYTISHDGYGFEQTQDMKDPAILKIKAGTDEFDEDYYFKTTGIANGGRIIRAVYVGNNKLFAQIHDKAETTQWDQTGLRYAIVDVVEKKITAVASTPIYDGAEDMFVEGNKVYIPAKVGNTLNVYEVDVTTATAKKGVEIEATYIKGLGKLTK